jgi:hypothetical protein
VSSPLKLTNTSYFHFILDEETFWLLLQAIEIVKTNFACEDVFCTVAVKLKGKIGYNCKLLRFKRKE